MMPKDSEEERDRESEPEETAEAETLEQALAEEKKKAEEYLASWQRAQADFINYKRRTEQERQELGRFANASLLLELLPVLDDLERSVDAMPPEVAGNDWSEGINMVIRKFRSGLESRGVTPIQAVGEPFDPNFHEALREEKGKKDTVIEEYETGYMLGDRVLRPARVVVGNGEEEEKEDSDNG
jgi:molecular chaperone GrpE